MEKIMNITLEQMAEKILNAKNIGVFGHIKTDIDCITSLLAFSLLCDSLNIKSHLFIDSNLPENSKHLPFIERINSSEIQKFDIVISLDTGAAERLGKYKDLFCQHGNSLKIDHHEPNEYAKFEYLDSSLPANCLIIKKLQALLKVKDSDQLNYLLLSGVLADTGCFKYNSTNSETFKITSEIIKNVGFDYSSAVVPLFQSVDKTKRLVQARAMNNSRFYENNKIAVMFVSNNDLKDLRASLIHSSQMSYLAQEINTVKIVICVTEGEKGVFSVSYYSKGDIDISECAKAFGGGGHKGAAGCKVFGSANVIIPKLVDEARKALEKYDEK